MPVDHSTKRRGAPVGTERGDQTSSLASVSNADREDELARLSKRYRLPLIAYFNRRTQSGHDAEDLAQEVLLRLIQREDFADLENLDGFIFTTAGNLLVDRARKAKVRELGQPEIEAQAGDADVFTPERVIQSKQELTEVLEVLADLPERTRDIFILARLEGFKYGEIADMYGISKSGVGKHMIRALARVMKMVKL